jgi:hypothetical protein
MAAAIAFNVSLAFSVSALEYTFELVVGVEPSVV